MKNNVKKLREKKKLSQRSLAELAGTSQQQIQRIESRQMATGMETAMAISAALQTPLDKVFPGATAAYTKLVARRQATGYEYQEDLDVASSGPGIELDPSSWTLVYRLSGHETDEKMQIPASEARRLQRLLRQGVDVPGFLAFVVFDSHTHRVALRLTELSFAHFLFDPVCGDIAVPESEMEPQGFAYLAGSSNPIRFSVDHEVELSEDADEEEQGGQLGIVFDELEAGILDDGQWIDIQDIDGEHLFIRAADIAMLAVEIRALSEPEYSETED